MKKITLIFTVILIGSLAAHGNIGTTPAYGESGNSITFWNKIVTEYGLENKLSPPRLARAYTLTHVAAHDALLEAKNFNQYRSTDSQEAIVSGAISEVLIYLFPEKSVAIKDIALQTFEKNMNDKTLTSFEFGQSVGKQVVSYAKNDGSDAVFSRTIPTGDCKWRGTNPLEPTAGQWKTMIISSGNEIQPLLPEPCDSEKYKEQIKEIVNASQNRTEEQIKIIHYWGDTPPPTLWNNILSKQVQENKINLFDAARAYAYLNVGMYDAGVSTWNAKFTHWTERPFEIIPGFVSEIPTPNFPAYVSGHSAFSGSASIILSEIFPIEKKYFEDQAKEANMSRIWGGLHLRQDCDEGMALGNKVGSKVIDDMRQKDHPFIYEQNSTDSTDDEFGTTLYVTIFGVMGFIVAGIMIIRLKRRGLKHDQ